MRVFKKSLICILIQLLIFSQGAFCADILCSAPESTLSPSVSLNVDSLKKLFESSGKKYERILHWTREGAFLDSVFDLANSPQNTSASKEIIQKTISRLQSHYPLGKIVAKGKIGDRFVVFEVPGISREGFGIKDLNGIFGYELNTQLIQIRSKLLYQKMLKNKLISGEEGHVYSTYKEDVYLVKRDLQIELPVLKEILNEIKQELITEIDQVIRTQNLYRDQFEKNVGKVSEQEKIVYAINMGISGAIAQDSDEARLNADINAHQAISLGNDISFTMKYYEETINKIDKLRDQLIENTLVFENDDSLKDIYSLRQKISDILRKNKQWDELTDDLKLYFMNNISNFKKAQEYFSYLHIQDYIKKWQVGYDQAKQRAQEIAGIIQDLQKMLKDAPLGDDGISANAEISDLFKRAYAIISTEAKDPSLSSAFVFHGQATKMKRPIAITLDIKNMGLMNIKSFEVELQLISRALKQGDTQEVQRLWRSAADDVTISLQKVMQITKDILKYQLKLDSSNVVELMGGDEFTLIVDKESITSDDLAKILQYIKRYVQFEFGIGVRLGATFAIDSFRGKFSYKQDLQNQFAHAKALIALDEGVERLKGDEAKGEHSTLVIQNSDGLWVTYRDYSEDAKLITKKEQPGLELTAVDQAI